MARRKLTDDMAKRLREEYATGKTQAVLAERYGVSQGLVSRIVRGVNHPDAGGPIAPARNATGPRRLDADGNVRCAACGLYKPREEFSTRGDLVESYCKACKARLARRYRTPVKPRAVLRVERENRARTDGLRTCVQCGDEFEAWRGRGHLCEVCGGVTKAAIRRRENRRLRDDGLRRCSICDEIKPLSEYYLAHGGNSYQSACKACTNRR